MNNAGRLSGQRRRLNIYSLKKTGLPFFYGVFRAFLIFGLVFLILQPLLQKLSVSFMSFTGGYDDFLDPSVVNIPRHFTLDNYRLADSYMQFFPTLLRTFFICVISSVLQITTCLLAGYGFARFTFPLKKLWFMCVMIIIIVPPQLLYAPLYLRFTFFDIFGLIRLITGSSVNLLNSLIGYIMVYTTGMGLKSGLYIFILRQYFRTLPKELEEAAYVDGCGKAGTLIRIILPDAMPMITSCFLFSFVWQWTDSLYTRLFLSRLKVLATALSELGALYGRHGSNALTNDVYAHCLNATGIIMTIAPLIALYLIAQRAFVQSLSQTGIKM